MELQIGMFLKCHACRAGTVTEIIGESVSTSDYDKHWGLNVYKVYCAYVQEYEDR